MSDLHSVAKCECFLTILMNGSLSLRFLRRDPVCECDAELYDEFLRTDSGSAVCEYQPGYGYPGGVVMLLLCLGQVGLSLEQLSVILPRKKFLRSAWCIRWLSPEKVVIWCNNAMRENIISHVTSRDLRWLAVFPSQYYDREAGAWSVRPTLILSKRESLSHLQLLKTPFPRHGHEFSCGNLNAEGGRPFQVPHIVWHDIVFTN